jgi:ketosteroid isomerase-like protein
MRAMSRIFAMPMVMGAVMVLAACQQGGAVTSAADEAAVKKVLADIVTTFNAGDYDGMLANYEDDVLVQASIGTEITSKEAWRQSLKTSMPPGVKLLMRFDTSELKVAGDLAYERGVYTIGMADAAAQPPLFKGRYAHILKRNASGAWKGWRLFEIIDQVPPGFVAPGAPAAAAAPAGK